MAITNDPQWRGSLAYMDIMCRRLRDCITRPDEDPTEESEISSTNTRQLTF
jgi:hypothetical protein